MKNPHVFTDLYTGTNWVRGPDSDSVVEIFPSKTDPDCIPCFLWHRKPQGLPRGDNREKRIAQAFVELWGF